MKLNYGSGFWNLNKNWKNADIKNHKGVDYIIDIKTSKVKNLKSNSCDVIKLRNVLHHVKDMSLVFYEINRLLKNNGNLILSEPPKNYWLRNIILDIWWYRIKIPRYHIWFSFQYRNWKKFRKKLDYRLISKSKEKYNEVEIWQKK